MSIPRDYVGEPQYPEPWTTRKPREGLRDLDEAKIVYLSPDVCWTPVGSSVVPIPYPVVDKCGHDQNYTPSVRFTRKKAMVMRSCTTHVHGDRPGVRKGRISGTVGDICEPIGHADQVRAEGSHVIRHLDRFYMNNKNTEGEAIFVRSTQTYDPPKDDDPVPGSLRWQNGSDAGRVMSDASPEPLIMGAQYAQLAQLKNQSATVPESKPSTSRTPPPRTYTNNVIQFPFEAKSPPQPAQRTDPSSVYGWMKRFGWYGVAIGSILLTPGDTPLIPPLPQDADPVEKDLNNQARDLLDPLDAKYNKEVQEWYLEQLRNYNETKRRNKEESDKQVAPVPETVRIEQEKEKQRCRVDKYEKMEPICRAIGMQAHHIVPDWTLRWGTRVEAIAGEKRIDTMPGYWRGQSICVLGNARKSGTEHNEAHLADGPIEALGRTSTPPFTASLEMVKLASIKAMTAVRPHCAKQIIDAVNGEFANSNQNQLLRAKQRVQDIPEPTMKILSNGRYQK